MTSLPARLLGASRALRVRRVRVRLAATLIAFGAAGLYASSQAAAQAPPAAQADACVAGQLRWGYEVGLVPGSDSGFSVDGIRVDAVPAGCVGHRVAITYSAGAAVVGSSVASLSVGVIDRVDRSGLGDVVVTAASLAPVS